MLPALRARWPWLARLALCERADPTTIAVVATSAAVIGTPASWRQIVQALDEARLLGPADESGMPGRPLDDDARAGLLNDLAAAGTPLDELRRELAQAVARLDLAIDWPDDFLNVQLAIWARQGQHWEELERLMLATRSGLLAASPAGKRVFTGIPAEVRRARPSLSDAVVLAAGRPADGEGWDWGAVVRTLINEGRLHADWARQVDVDRMVCAASLWMYALSNDVLTQRSCPEVDAWQIRTEVLRELRSGTHTGALSTRTEALFHGRAALVALARGQFEDAAREADLATMLGELGASATFLGAVSLALASRILGDRAGMRRGQDLLLHETASGALWTHLVHPLADLVPALTSFARLDAGSGTGWRERLTRSWDGSHWLALRPLMLITVTQLDLLWRQPVQALADFQNQLHLMPAVQPPLIQARLRRYHAELQLKAGSLKSAFDLLRPDDAEPPAITAVLAVPRARAYLCGGEPRRVVAEVDASIASTRNNQPDRAELRMLKAVALLQLGTAAAVVERQIELACELSEQCDRPAAFAFLPADVRAQVLGAHRRIHAGRGCRLLALDAEGVFDRLQPGYPAPRVRLTPRERELLPLLASPLTVQQIADHLVLSVNTVRKQVLMLREKFGARSRAELLVKARDLEVL